MITGKTKPKHKEMMSKVINIRENNSRVLNTYKILMYGMVKTCLNSAKLNRENNDILAVLKDGKLNSMYFY